MTRAPVARDADGAIPGYFDGPFPAEDGGPRRQLVPRARGLGLQPGEGLGVTARTAAMANMVVLRGPGEVFLQGSTSPGPENAGFVERLDPVTLATLARSSDLPAGGVWWPGSIAAHVNGFLYVVHGRFCHKLDPDCRVVARRALPQARPYNGFLLLSDGNLVTKSFVRDGTEPSRLTVLEPDRLEPAGPEVEMPEPSIARISRDLDARGEWVYVVGARSIFRYRYAGGRLVRDEGWRGFYRQLPDDVQSYGWDAVIADGSAWFMDNGDNVFQTSFRDGGVASGPLHLVRVDLANAADLELFAPFDLPRGTIANPPLIAPGRRMVVAYDSGNGRIGGFQRGETGWTSRWEHPFGAANHFLCYPDTGEIVVNDFREDIGEHVVVLDLETGVERGRVAIGSPVQSVLFQACGFTRDLYCCTFTTVARIFAS